MEHNNQQSEARSLVSEEHELRICPHESEINLFCTKDSIYLCKKCKDTLHKGHIMTKLEDQVNFAIESINDIDKEVLQAKEDIELLQNKIGDSINKQFEEALNKVETELEQQLGIAKLKIQEEKQKQILEASEKYNKKWENIQELKKEVDEVIERAKHLDKDKKHLSILREFLVLHTKLAPIETVHPIHIKDSQISIVSDSENAENKVKQAVYRCLEGAFQFGTSFTQVPNQSTTHLKELMEKDRKIKELESAIRSYQTEILYVHNELHHKEKRIEYLDRLMIDHPILIESKSPKNRAPNYTKNAHFNQGLPMKDILYFGKWSKIWKVNVSDGSTSMTVIPTISIQQFSRTVFTSQNQFFITSSDSPEYNQTIEINLQDFTPTTKTNLIHSRYHHAFVETSSDILMAIAGRNEVEVLNKCELYSISQNMWVEAPSTHKKRAYSTAFTFSSKYVYVFGGINEEEKAIKVIEILELPEDITQIGSSDWHILKVHTPLTSFPSTCVGNLILDSKEVMIFGELDTNGNITKQCVIFDMEAMTLRDGHSLEENDNFIHSKTAYADNKYYVLSSNGNMHIYDGKCWDYKPKFISI